MPGPGRHHRRRGHRLSGRVAGRRSEGAGRARRLQGRDPYLDLRPPDHPGSRVGGVPPAGAPAPHRCGRLLRAGLQGHGRPVRARALPPRRQRPGRRHLRPPAQADRGGQPHQHVPGAGAPHRPPGSARLERPAHAPRAGPGHARAERVGPGAGVPHQRSGRLRADASRRHPRHPPRRLLPDGRRRVHVSSRSPTRSTGSRSTSKGCRPS